MGPFRIYLVESNRFVRDSVKRLIHDEDDLTLCGESGDIGLAAEAIRAHVPDLILMDPNFHSPSNGIKVIQTIKLLNVSLPILILSDIDESTHAQEVLWAGAQGFIMKEDARQNL